MELRKSIVGSRTITGLLSSLKETKNIEGEVWECGVFMGGTASRIVEQVPKTQKIRLFDSFEGLPEHTPTKDNHHRKGDFKPDQSWSYLDVVKYFDQHSNVSIHKGWIPESFVGLEKSVISFCHLDLDLYQGYLDVLNFVWPRLTTGGIIVFDDYVAGTCLGAKAAVDEWTTEHKVKIQQSSGNTSYVRIIKL